ncbi:MAG: CaiB/BaiF CoA-transferase family protein, partial [Halobacteriales archaeon]|nr:CaiB/BaiF CoA-transferase family protein [Halobacteriales archaeon]
LGADVVKVERPPDGDPVRRLIPGFFQAVNRNKRSVAIDLKAPEATPFVDGLLGWAEVVIEGFRPGVAERLGIGPTRVAESHPDVVYCSISGYGQNGPARNRPGHDLNYLSIAGALVPPPEGESFQPSSLLPAADIIAGSLATTTILGCVMRARATGQGSVIDFSIADAVALAMAAHLNESAERGHPGATTLASRPGEGVYRAADGLLLSVSATEDVFWERLCDVLHVPQDERGASRRVDRLEFSHELEQMLRDRFLTREREEWLERLLEADVPAAPVNDLSEVVAEPVFAERGVVRRATSPDEGGTRIDVAFPARINGTRPGLDRPPPDVGEHTDEVMRLVGLVEGQRRRLVESGAVLSRP